MIVFILLCLITGFSIINILLKKEKLLNIIVLSIPIGIVFHTVIFILLALMNIYYNKYLFIVISLLSLLSFIKRRIKIEKDNKRVPIYYIIFIMYIIIKLLMMANSGFFEFYNYDEFTAYQTGSTIMYLSHEFSTIYGMYAPINFFIGVLSLEFSGISLTAARLMSVVFFGLTSLGIYSKLRDSKVNKHISALIAMIFLISSSEMLQVAKSFYNNIFFMFYFTIGIYSLIEYYVINKNKGIPYIPIILCFGAALTRIEVMYFMIVILFIMSLILFIKKIIVKKEMFIMNSFVLFPIIMKIAQYINQIKFDPVVSENRDTLIERFLSRIEPNNFNSYLENLITQTFKQDYYYFNYIIYILLVITILVVLFKLIKKQKQSDKKYIFASVTILIFEFMYIGIIILTQLFKFTITEYLIAASFSRYINSISVINFIVLGTLLFYNTDKDNKKNMKNDNSSIKINKKNPKILLIIPAYNEEENILNTYLKIIDYNKKYKKNYNVIVINDGSQDNTKSILEDNNIPHINLVRNLGIGGAVQTGYKYAHEHDYDIAIQFDGDGQHDIECIEIVTEPIIKKDIDFVIGSRFINKQSLTFKSTITRRIGIKIISIFIQLFTRKKIFDTTSGFRAVNKSIIKEFSDNYPTEYPEPVSTTELLKKGYKVEEVPVNMNERQGGVSSIRAWKSIYYMINVILSIFIIGMRRYKK